MGSACGPWLHSLALSCRLLLRCRRVAPGPHSLASATSKNCWMNCSTLVTSLYLGAFNTSLGDVSCWVRTWVSRSFSLVSSLPPVLPTWTVLCKRGCTIIRSYYPLPIIGIIFRSHKFHCCHQCNKIASCVNNFPTVACVQFYLPSSDA